jgi:hypothetical protein
MEALSPDPRSIRPGTLAGRCGVALAYTGLYLGAALWGRDMQVLPGITPWFPAVGLTLALLVGFGPRWLPLAFGAELVSGVVIYDIDATFTTAQVLLNTALISGTYAAAAVVLRNWLRIDTSLRDFRSLFWLLVIGVIVFPLFTALPAWACACGPARTMRQHRPGRAARRGDRAGAARAAAAVRSLRLPGLRPGAVTLGAGPGPTPDRNPGHRSSTALRTRSGDRPNRNGKNWGLSPMRK